MCFPMNLEFTSAPWLMRRAMVSDTLGKLPGQSVAMCNRVRDPLTGLPMRTVESSGFSLSKCFRAATSPARIALTLAIVSGSSVCIFRMVTLFRLIDAEKDARLVSFSCRSRQTKV